ncbi:MAG TPA: hypothetical protein VFX48_05285 [Saprospiraceae bacterium]|nr:hypothetical protein [Saprospiraceae bacterium]
MDPVRELQNQKIVFRLTALWALNESGLGGFMHAMNLPFTGLIVGSIAVALITFIVYFSEGDKSTLFNALVIVLLIKLLLSPHSSVTAYFAVSFQAICAFIFYRLLGLHLISIIMVCVVTFVESASQKLITLTIIGGMSFWNAIDVFIENIARQFFQYSLSNASLWLVGSYYAIYVGFALLSAFFIYSLLEEFRVLNFNDRPARPLPVKPLEPRGHEGKRKSPWIKYVMYLGIIAFVVATFLVFGNERYKDNFVVYYFLRTFAVVLFWYYILMPYAMVIVKKYLNKKLPAYQNEVDEILNILPELKQIIFHAWEESASRKGLRRLKHFFTLALIEILTYK